MKAIRVSSAGPPSVLKLEDVPTPSPAAGQLLIRLLAAGEDRSDSVAKGVRWLLTRQQPDGSWTRYRTRAEFLDQIRAIVRQDIVDVMLAIDVQGCPTDFRSAWYDYLVQVRNLHRRTDRVALFAAAAGKPVTNLPGLIKVAVGSPELGQYLLDALSQEDAAWEKLERSAMNNGVMPKP